MQLNFKKKSRHIDPENYKKISRTTPWGEMTYLDYKKKIEFGPKEFDLINSYCKKKKIIWFASAWDKDSLKFLKKYNLRYNKIASAMLTNHKLLRLVAKERKTTFISTGMSTFGDISRAISIFKKEKCKFILMHCVSTYPCPINKLNLNAIITLKEKFNCEVGYSGHESSVSPTLIAYFLGANYIERHITLDRSMWGTDQAASLSETGMKTLKNILYKAPKVLGNGSKKISIEDKKMLNKFKYW